MFKILHTLLFSISVLALSAQDNALNLPALDIYPFNGRYINLKTFQTFDLDAVPALTFKSKSVYATRFRGLAIDKLVFKGKMFEVQSDNGLLYTDLATKAAMPLRNPEKGWERYGQNYLIESADGMVYIKNLNADKGFMIYKYDASGNELLAVQLPHSEWVERPSIKYQRPFLKYLTHTKWQLVFSSYLKDKNKTFVVELSNGQILEYDFAVQGIIRDEKDDAFVNGFIQLDGTTGKMNITYRTDNFELKNTKFLNCNSVETLLKGETLFLSVYNERSSGTHLLAVDLVSKQVLWEQTIVLKTPPAATAATSHYFHLLWLSFSNEQILLEGMEPQLKYLQAFDLKTGKVLQAFEEQKN